MKNSYKIKKFVSEFFEKVFAVLFVLIFFAMIIVATALELGTKIALFEFLTRH